jgi:hypothetical protein
LTKSWVVWRQPWTSFNTQPLKTRFNSLSNNFSLQVFVISRIPSTDSSWNLSSKASSWRALLSEGKLSALKILVIRFWKRAWRKRMIKRNWLSYLKRWTKLVVLFYICFVKIFHKFILVLIFIVKNKNINTRLAYIDLTKQILTKLPEDRIPEVQITILTNCYNLMNTSTDIVKLQIIDKCKWVIEFLCNETKQNVILILWK